MPKGLLTTWLCGYVQSAVLLNCCLKKNVTEQDFDEFFVPKLPNTNLMDIINFAEYGSKNNRNLQKFFPTTHPHSDVTKNPVYSAYRDWDNIKSEVGGLADGDGHPFCFIIIDSETINSNGEAVDNIYNPWIGTTAVFADDMCITSDCSPQAIALRMEVKRTTCLTRNQFSRRAKFFNVVST